MTSDRDSTRTDQTATRSQHAGMALFWLMAVSAAFAAPIYLITHYTNDTAYAALLGMAIGMWVRDFLMEYLRHAIGILNPRWAARV